MSTDLDPPDDEGPPAEGEPSGDGGAGTGDDRHPDETMARYFDRIEADLDRARTVAERARERGDDPSPSVEIPTARDMADRVEKVLGIDGVAERVRELESETSREAATLRLAEDFASGRIGDFETPAETVEGAVRTAVALLTEGVVAAPIEGIDGVETGTNDDGSTFVRVEYAGPIRSAGGTAQALSVLVADYARTLLGLSAYRPRADEVERLVEEVGLYDDDTGLQYTPKDAETRHVARSCPIMLDGEPTSEGEVGGYRDLDRIGTNRARGGLCLVLAEGIIQKAPKIRRYTDDLDDLDWPWLDALIEGIDSDGGDDAGDGGTDDANDTAADSADGPAFEAAPVDGPPRVEPSKKYLRDLIAGRPVFGHPSEPGGFRLRYGRARNHGNATAGIHPATMHLVEFLAPGTQLKTERPGKAAGVVPVDTIEGPTVRLADGTVRRVETAAEARELRNGVDAILDLGEYLVNYGEFVENNHPFAPASYTVDWWAQEYAAAGGDLQALRDDPRIDTGDPDPGRALDWAERVDAPLHPRYTYTWHDIDVAALDTLADAVAAGEVGGDALVVDRTPPVREALESLLVEHEQSADAIRVGTWRPLVRSLGATPGGDRTWALDDLSAGAREWPNAVRAVNEIAPFAVRERAPTRIGARMGRPEKSEPRELSPAVHALFPIGEAGGDQRDVVAAADRSGRDRPPGTVEVAVGDREAVRAGREVEPERRAVDVRERLDRALDTVGERERAFDVLKGVKGLTSAAKVPEPLGKGVLRAKHDVTAFKDGTVRYDMTDLPVTSVRPSELDVSVDRLRELGYETDVHGDPLRHDDQLVELRVQDVVLSDGAADHLLRTADFVDDLLTEYYGLEPFYGADQRDDLVGELVFGMAPHTSAAVVGRVVGFTSAAVGYAHPYFHAAKRRNCFHPDTKLRYEDETGTWRHERIDRFVEDRIDDPREDDFGTLVEEVDGVRASSVDTEGTATARPVESVSKHPAPDHLVRIETEGGRSIRVTPDHELLRWSDDELEPVRASEIGVGDAFRVSDHPPTDGVGNRVPIAADGGSNVDEISKVEYVQCDLDHVYCLTVEGTHALFANGLSAKQCDGDEDCVMLLLDGLLNFSLSYLPDKRGGRMDAPLVMTSRIDPTEIDDEAHNVDVVGAYPRSFYEATRELADPDAVEVEIAEASLGEPDEYRGFDHTHDTSDIAGGPSLSAYKTLGSMEEKTDAQLELARKLRAVDESDVAERIIEYHFLPDLIGNLRAFSSQKVRCLDCGTDYRRPPLTGDCRECGGDVTLTVHEGSVNKYVGTAAEVAETYDARPYTKQRIEIIDRSLESLFEDDTNKQSGIADFM